MPPGVLAVLSGAHDPGVELPLAKVPAWAYAYRPLQPGTLSLRPASTPPCTGRGFSLLSTGVEPNPGPASARCANYIGHTASRFLARWSLEDHITLEDDVAPEPGPSSNVEAPPRGWLFAECTCGASIALYPHGLRGLVTHVTTCDTLHRATGRGDTLASCGDIEANPGPGLIDLLDPPP